MEKHFDINLVLMAVFSSLEILRGEKKIELVYNNGAKGIKG